MNHKRNKARRLKYPSRSQNTYFSWIHSQQSLASSARSCFTLAPSCAHSNLQLATPDNLKTRFCGSDYTACDRTQNQPLHFSNWWSPGTENEMPRPLHVGDLSGILKVNSRVWPSVARDTPSFIAKRPDRKICQRPCWKGLHRLLLWDRFFWGRFLRALRCRPRFSLGAVMLTACTLRRSRRFAWPTLCKRTISADGIDPPAHGTQQPKPVIREMPLLCFEAAPSPKLST